MENVPVPQWFRHSDKLFHFIEYTALAMSGFFAFRAVRGFRFRLLLFGVAYALFDEMHQSFVPGRVADFGDIIADVLPFFLLWLIRFPLPCSTIAVKGKYITQTYELLRSVIKGKKVSVDGAADLTIWVTDEGVRYFYEGSMLLERKIPKITSDAAKLSVYRDCEFLFDRRISDWGLLYMMRPSKILEHVQGSTNERSWQLQTDYALSAQKTSLLLEIEEVQKDMLKKTEGSCGIYIGVPFCPSRCSYCSFTSYPREKFAKFYNPYIDALIKELSTRLAQITLPVTMIYIGGGTPFVLDACDLERILRALKSVLSPAILEFTCEAGRPELFTEEKLGILKKYGVTRIAINPQTVIPATLERIGRKHSVEDFYRAYEMAARFNFSVINADIILGLPGETPEYNKQTVSTILAMEKINSLTVHALAPKHGAAEQTFIDDDSIKKAYAAVNRLVRKNKFLPYYIYKQRHIGGNLENIGYCKTEAYSYYNVSIIGEHNTIYGFGPGASTKYVTGRSIKTVRNAKDLSMYINAINNGNIHNDSNPVQGG